jgi:TldD protein
MDGHDLSEYAVELGSNLGASYTEARFVREATEGYSTRNGDILSAGKNEREGMGIRVLVEGNLGFCSLDELTKESIEDSLKSTVSTARRSGRKDPIEMSDEEIHEDSWESEVKMPFEEVEMESKVGFLTDLDESLSSLPGDLPIRTFFMKLIKWEKYLATSEGARINGIYSLFSLNVMFQAQVNGNSEQRRFGIGGTGGWEWAEEMGTQEKILSDASRTLEVVAKAKSMDLGEVDLVIGPEVAGIVAHENCGHPSEGDRILGREAAQAGESWYVDLEVGESRIGSDALTIIDDPTIPGSAGFYLYDDEGVKARPRHLIERGE